ncbi:MAG: PAS domain S-box protein, partial [Anaerolineae bacterium]|nr:PAS domain S-box protein [Anaerolineae bacterium]
DELIALCRSINRLLETAQRAQQSLTENQLRTQQIVTSISDVLYVAHMNAAHEIVNHQMPSPQVADLTGYPHSRFDADWMFWQSLILPEDRAHAMLTSDHITHRHSREIEYRIRDAHGNIHWIRDSVYIAMQPDGTAVLYGVMSDITARKQTEADLAAREHTAREFQDRLKALLRVSTELAQAPDVDTLMRRAIELSRNELGFDRMGLWLLDHDDNMMVGTYGTDSEGHLCDQRHLRRPVAEDAKAEELLRDRKWSGVWHDTTLYEGWEAVGEGWNAIASLWEGDKMLGWFAADNLLSGAPLASYQVELLSLYSATVAQLITRKRAEQALRESEARYTALFQRMPVELYRTAPDGKLLDANSAMVQLMGHDDLDTMRKCSTSDFYVDPADRGRWQKAIERAGELYDYEVQLKRRDGSTLWGRETSRTVYDEDGNVLYYEGHIRDVTAEKEAEEALAAERNLLRTLIDTLPDHIYVKDTAGRVLLSNTANAQIMGADSPNNVLGKTDADFYPPELAAQYAADDQTVIKTGTPVVNRVEPLYQEHDDERRWMRTTKVPLRDTDGTVIGLVGVGHDITIERHTAEALRNSQERLDLALQATGLGLWDWYVQTEQVVFNARWAEIAGYSLEELGHLTGVWETLVHPDDWLEVDRRLRAHLEGHTPYFEAEYRLCAKSGTVKWVLDRGKVVQRDEDGTPIRMIGTLRDISERRRTEHALRESQERLDFVLRGANLGLWDWTVQTDELVINERWAEMLGYTQSEFGSHGAHWEALVHPDDKPDVLRLQNAHMAGETPFYEAEYRLRTKAGRWCWVQSRGQVVRRGPDNTPLRMSGTHIDITARKQADAERDDLLQQTRSRAAELATVAEVSQQAARILNVNELLWAVCKLVQENFGLYHVQVYLLEGDRLQLTAGVGDAGRQMIELGHYIPLAHTNSVVAEAARTRQAVVANDVAQTDAFLPNVLLPETRAEIALPMLVGDQVIGVLDVQDTVMNRFTPQDIQIQATLAAQTGIAIYNARLFTENARRLAIIEHSQDMIALTSHDTPSYFPAYVNPAGLRTLGYTTLDDVTEQSLAVFYPPEDFARFSAEVLPEVQAKGSWRGELTIQRSDGTLIPVEQTFFLIYDEQGRPQDLATIMTDITPRKQADAALHRANRAYRALSDCNQATIRATDEAHLLHEVCDIMVRINGYR